MTTAPIPGFPAGFRWGVSTSAYQIEGGATADGRGPSIWDTFAHTPGRILDGSTGDVACDHYHRYREDVALLAGLGVSAYRFSIAWPRVRPAGTGPVNAAGLDFYDRLVDDLLAAGIDPVATLFHWDLPQPLEDAGGWLNRDTAAHFAEYAELTAARLGDRVKLWITLNEPFIHLSLGHGTGEHAPGRTLLFDSLPAAHHQLLGHGLAVAALRAHSTAPVAIANNYSPVVRHGDTDADRAAAAAYDDLHNHLFTDPLLGRGYPDGLDPGVVRDGDLAVIAAPLDVLGVNYYNPTGVRAPEEGSPVPFTLVPLEGYPRTAFDWPVVPDGLRDLLVGLRDRYGDALPTIQVTEGGCAWDDVPDADGRVHDPDRIAYLDGHLRAVRAAIDEGVDVTGYFVWSLLDNWEWAEGFTKRFGLVHVDFPTGTRTPKSSYAWYRSQVGRG
ncbi:MULTISPECIES: GH1 family beta-glucosidase [Micromonospora]|uniref:Beta-glucosidase n=1 Tax=Micromonospora rifamycinica TaxID=291594 RepID=A0A120F783_9ACTN|nr:MULTISPECIES: GH1 family beta-glucosidase [Micromonospora]KWV29812.1 beta-glucosidase [Micromonospora rifamycinica]WFE67222.1 GH1 family beta-glucosidase [Micromonospora sp. WMMD714]SCG80825.1 beta-glucosidase [Micromonospora rifamycinica]